MAADPQHGAADNEAGTAERALAQAMARAGPRDGLLVSLDKVAQGWEYSIDGGVEWDFLAAASTAEEVLAQRLRYVGSDTADPDGWLAQDGFVSGAVVETAALVAVADHGAGRWRLCVTVEASLGPEGTAITSFDLEASSARCLFEAAERVAPPGGDTPQAADGDAWGVSLRNAAASAVPDAADADEIIEWLADTAWGLHTGDIPRRVALFVVARLADGTCHALAASDPAVVEDPDDSVLSGLDTGRGWVEMPAGGQQGLSQCLETATIWHLESLFDDPDDDHDYEDDEDDEDGPDGDFDSFDETDSLDGHAPGGVPGDDLDDFTDFTDPENARRTLADVSSTLDVLDLARAALSAMSDALAPDQPLDIDTLTDRCDDIAEAAEDLDLEGYGAMAPLPVTLLAENLQDNIVRLDAPLLSASAGDPQRQLAEACAALVEDMDRSCLIERCEVAAAALILAAQSPPEPAEAAHLRSRCTAALSDAARSDVKALGPAHIRWHQAVSHLLRELRGPARRRKHNKPRDTQRDQRLARKLLAKTDHLAETLRNQQHPLHHDDPLPQHTTSDGLEALDAERGWQPGADGVWALSEDPRRPRLIATPAQADRPAALILLPPSEGPLTATWNPSQWQQRMQHHEPIKVTAVPVGDAYETCSGCGCPLIAEDASQNCPSCGRRIRTAVLDEQARGLTAITAHFDTEQAAAQAALAESAGFRAWMLALAAQTQ